MSAQNANEGHRATDSVKFPPNRCHDTVALSWWTNSSNSVFREMSLPRTAETAVIRNLSLLNGNGSESSLAHYVQINLKSSGSIVVQGETRSFTVSDLEKFKGTLAVVGDPSNTEQALSTPLIVLLAVLLVLAALAAALFFVIRRHKYKSCGAGEKGREAAAEVHYGNGGSRIEMYGEIAHTETSGENLLGDAQMAAASPIPEWPEPPPQWPEPGTNEEYEYEYFSHI